MQVALVKSRERPPSVTFQTADVGSGRHVAVSKSGLLTGGFNGAATTQTGTVDGGGGGEDGGEEDVTGGGGSARGGGGLLN